MHLPPDVERAALRLAGEGPAAAALVPVPPSVNNLFLTAGRRRVKSKGYRDWLAVAVPRLASLPIARRYPVAVAVVITGTLHAARDLDNLLKPIGDALVSAGVIEDDRCGCVARWSVEYRPGPGLPTAEVRVEGGD